MLKDLGDGTAFCSISTFSGGGIGDAGVEWGASVPVISACELVPDRAGLIRHNYPETEVFQGDIWNLKSNIINHIHPPQLMANDKPTVCQPLTDDILSADLESRWQIPPYASGKIPHTRYDS